jgi:signal transduction histidine kinase/ActR/RegA family two-component response regulator
MSKERWDREREALRRLARVLAEEARGGLLEEALEIVLDQTRAEAGAAFVAHGTTLELVAERGFAKPSGRGTSRSSSGARSKHPPLADVRPPVAAAARRTASSRKGVYLVDLAEARADAERREDLIAHGFRTILGRAVKHQRQVHGVLLLASKDASLFDPQRLGFVETVAHMVALAAECHARSDRELAYRATMIEVGRMSALGWLAAATAREFKDILGQVRPRLTLQSDVLGRLREAGTDWAKPMIAEIDEQLAASRLAVAELQGLAEHLAVAAEPAPTATAVDLSALIRETLAVVRGEFARRGLGLTEDYVPGCVTSGRRNDLVQIVLTLVLDAADACTRAGHPRPGIAVRTGIDGSRVVLSIEDTGPEVASDDPTRLFQPFSSDGGEGGRRSGFGLTIAHDLVAAHHGRIEAVNLELGGAAMRVVLPRVSLSEMDDAARLGSTQPPPGDKDDLRQVLVVDDDDLFAQMVRRSLRPHDVRFAATASEAEIALLDQTYSPNLVLCDLLLPGMTGDMLHARVLARRPELAPRFVFVTAGAATQDQEQYLAASGCPTLIKPIDVKKLCMLLDLPTPLDSLAPPRRSSLPADTPRGSKIPHKASETPTRRPM